MFFLQTWATVFASPPRNRSRGCLEAPVPQLGITAAVARRRYRCRAFQGRNPRSSLSAEGKFEQMPFMPEMLANCGRQFRVAAVAHKTCDPAHKTGGRRLDNTVHLEGLRCDGSAHGGCQAACLLFWKAAWLKHPDAPEERPGGWTPMRLAEAQLWAATQAVTSSPDKPIYSCQATCLFCATRPLKWWDARQYVRDISSGNVKLWHALTFLFLSWLRALTRVGAGAAGRRVRCIAWPTVFSSAARRPKAEAGFPRARRRRSERSTSNLVSGRGPRLVPNDDSVDTVLGAGARTAVCAFDDEARGFVCGGEFRDRKRRVEARAVNGGNGRDVADEDRLASRSRVFSVSASIPARACSARAR